MISFYQAAERLEYICDQIENCAEISQELQKDFEEFKHDLAAAVDRRISYIKYCQSQIELAKKTRDEWHGRAAKFENILERIKANAMEVMRMNPGLAYKGNMGYMRLQKNTVPALVIEDEQDLLSLEQYQKASVLLDKSAVKKDLENGIVLKGARLEWGEHLRIGVK